MRIHHIAFRCPSVADTAQFYVDLLGFRVVNTQPGHAIWLAAGEVMLMLEQAGSDEPHAADGMMRMLAFCQDDAPPDLRQRLRKADVPIEAETDYTYYFRDPDGRRLGISTYVFGGLTDKTEDQTAT